MNHSNRQTDSIRLVQYFAWISLAFTALSVILRILCLFLFFDSDIGYDRSDALLPVLSYVWIAIGMFFLAGTALLRFHKNKLIRPVLDSNTLPLRITAGIAAVGLFALAVSDIVKNGNIWMGLMGLGACLYFLMQVSGTATLGLRVLTGLFVIARLLAMLASTYLDIMVPMNAPDKVLLLLACAAAMLFLICEIRVSVSGVRPALYSFSLSAAILLTGTASLPSIIASLTDSLSGSTPTIYYYVLLTFCIYAIARLLALPFHSHERPNEEESVENPLPESTETENVSNNTNDENSN